jgi:hypothetical protein
MSSQPHSIPSLVTAHPLAALPQDDAAPLTGIETLLTLFQQVPLVALGESAGLMQEWRFLTALVQHPDFAGTVDAVVVDFGSARYQALVDAYVSGGHADLSDVRRVWREQVDSAPGTFDAPVYEAFLRTVRQVNQALPPQRMIRLVLGGHPIVWSAVRTSEALLSLLWAQNAYFADVVAREVLASGRRALLIADRTRLWRSPLGDALAPGQVRRLSVPAPTIVQEVERAHGAVFLIEPHTGLMDDGENDALEARLAGWPCDSLALVRDTWLEAAVSGALKRPPARWRRPLRSGRGRLPDGYLYLGPRSSLTWALPDVAAFDDLYRVELRRRQSLVRAALLAERAARKSQAQASAIR